MQCAARRNAPHALLTQRFALLAVIVSCGIFFSIRKMYYICVLLLPLLYFLTMSAYPDNPSQSYENINDKKKINEILDALPTPEQEPTNWMSKMFSLVWPHMFAQERVDQFKDSLQQALDANPIPYFSSIRIVSLEIGDRAPQITQVTMPSKPQPAEDSVLYQVSMLYYPEFTLKLLVTPKDVPAFHITFTDPSFDMDWYMQFEFAPKPYIDGIKFLTGISASLSRKPRFHYEFFKVTLFTKSTLFNRDSIKKYMADLISDAMWSAAGFPNGFFYDRVKYTGGQVVVGSDKAMKRGSLSRAELLRYGRIKTLAKNFCDEHKLPEPMTVKIVSQKDQETSSYHMTLLNNLVVERTIENVRIAADEFSVNSPSEGELRYFIELAHDFVMDKFMETSEATVQRHKRNPNTMDLVKKFEEEVLSPVYVYLNFLNLQMKLNPSVSEELEFSERVKKMETMILGFHNKMFKLTCPN